MFLGVKLTIRVSIKYVDDDLPPVTFDLLTICTGVYIRKYKVLVIPV